MKKSIMFILPNLLKGGTQKVIINLANNLSTDKYTVYLVAINKENKAYKNKNYNEESFFNLIDQERVKYINLGCNGVKGSFFAFRKILKSVKPDIVFSSLSYVNLYIGLVKIGFPGKIAFIARESNTLSVKHRHLKVPKYMDWLYRIFYKRFDKIVCQSNDMFVDLNQNFGINKNKLITINNPINSKQTMAKGGVGYEYSNDKKHLVCIGHLSFQKGHDLLAQALAKIKRKDWECHLIGRDAGMETKVQEILTKYPAIAEKIHFHGFQSNPYQYLVNSDLFILSSRFEGFPNVLLEAGVYGLPIVAFDNPGGMAEIIQDKYLGELAKSNDPEDLAEKIEIALDENYDKKKIQESFIDRFDTSVIIAKYEALFDAL